MIHRRNQLRKLAAAIREGARLRPQATRFYFDDETEGSCALGAAAEAIGIDIRYADPNDPEDYITEALVEAFPVLNERVPPSTVAPLGCRSVYSWITLMNDNLKMTREEIAATLEQMASLEGL